MVDLRPLFYGLPSPPPSPDSPLLSAQLVPERPRFRVARDSQAHALVLLESDGAAPAMPPLALEHIRIEHARHCKIRQPDGGTHAGIFTIFSCTTTDVVLQDHFLLVAGALIATTAPNPQPDAIASAVETLAELFRALQAPARKSVQGLWAEVLLIAESRRPAELVKAWRAATDDRFDFSSRATRVEVKSTSGKERVHYFALDQLRPPNGVQAIIASILIERAGGGSALTDLLAELRAALASFPELILRIETIITVTLGSTLRVAMEERFDREAALGSLTYFRVEDVPCIREVPPVDVSDVRFRSNLGTAIRVDPRQFAQAGDPLIASLPVPADRMRS